MKFKKNLVRSIQLFILASWISICNFAASEDGMQNERIEQLKKEGFSQDWNIASNALQEMIKLRDFDSICDIFERLNPSHQENTAHGIARAGQTNLRTDRLILAFYKKTNTPILFGSHEQSNARDFGTIFCLRYLGEKYNVRFDDYSSGKTERQKLVVVAEIIGKLEAVISPELQTASLPLPEEKSGSDVNSANIKNTALAQTIIPASGSNTNESPAQFTKNWWPALTTVALLLLGNLVWLKLKKRP